MVEVQKHLLSERDRGRSVGLAVASCVVPSIQSERKMGWRKRSMERVRKKEWLVEEHKPITVPGMEKFIERLLRESLNPDTSHRISRLRYYENPHEEGIGEAHIGRLAPWRKQLTEIGYLESDWDGEDASPPSQALIDSVDEMLGRWVGQAWNLRGKRLDVPRIGPVTDGSIDVHWVSECYELLVNIGGSVEDAESGTYYGDDYADDRTEGTFRLDAATPTPLLWLMYR